MPALKTGRAFDATLREAIVGWSWDAVELRAAVLQIIQSHQIAIVLDRTVNPNRAVSLQIQSATLGNVLRQLAAEADAECRVIENLVYIADPATAHRLRTVIARRRAELLQADVDSTRLRELLSRHTIQWSDLTTAADVLADISRRWEIEIDGVDSVPHDLWAAASLPNVNAVEALALTLNGFQLSYEWSPQGSAVRVVACPERVTLAKRYRVRSGEAETTTRAWQTLCPSLDIRRHGSDLIVDGTVEQHEQIEQQRSGRRPPRPATSAAESSPLQTPLARRRFTLTAQAVLVADIMANLERSGVRFEYDGRAFEKAGIDLKQRVDIDLKAATAEELFAEMFGPLNVRFEVNGLRVQLKPARGDRD